ncbi:MAG TPA: YbhB/YbcL family Raf kinase inhibitor-like protein, partial [Methanocella sp.]|nr:YbhB/YbcL family Raf kinase inhibitor-like protein [Methanocella sp.]
RIVCCVVIAALALAGLAGIPQLSAADNGQVSHDMMQAKVMLLDVTSPAFKDGDRIPVKYTGDGDNMSPPLRWSGAPPGVSEYAIVCEDPDAPRGTYTHWVIYGIPGNYDHLDDGVMQVSELDNGAMQGKNSDEGIGYTGPSPPPGKPHRYEFKVYALSARLDLPSGITKEDLRRAMDGYVVAKGKLTGLYGR